MNLFRIACSVAREAYASEMDFAVRRLAIRIAASSGDSITVEAPVKKPVKCQPGMEYVFDFEGEQKISYKYGEGTVLAPCYFVFNEDGSFSSFMGTWLGGGFHGDFSDGDFNGGGYMGGVFNGRFNGGNFNEGRIENATVNTEDVSWRAKEYSIGENVVDENGAPLEEGKVMVWENRIHPGTMISAPGQYSEITGVVQCNDFSVYVDKAAFSFKADGEFTGFSGKMKLNKMKIEAENADFSLDVENNVPAITWRRGTWKDGYWTTGVWNQGTWENGTWDYGIWHRGNWKVGFDIFGNRHDDPPNLWNLGVNTSDHVKTDHPGRMSVIDEVLLNVRDDDTIYAMLYGNDDKNGQTLIVIYNNGYYASYSLDNDMLVGKSTTNQTMGISSILNTVHRFPLSLQIEKRFTQSKPYTQIVVALEIKRDKDGTILSVKPRIRPKPSNFALSDRLHKICLNNSIHYIFDEDMIENIKTFTGSHYNKWMKDLEEKIGALSPSELDDLNDHMTAIEYCWRTIFFNDTVQSARTFSRLPSKIQSMAADFAVDNGLFTSRSGFLKYAHDRNHIINDNLKNAWRRMMSKKAIW